MILAIVAYLPKSKADKRRSLLGGSKEPEEGEMVSEVCFFTKVALICDIQYDNVNILIECGVPTIVI